MLRNKLVRSDGSIIDSSVIISCEYTEAVNSSKNLTVGDVTASEITVEMLSTNIIQQDEVLTYSIIEDGVETQIGVFKAEKPTVATRTSMSFSAYDNVVKTEKAFSDWLRNNQKLFPMSLLTLVEYACSYCDVSLATPDFPHADLSVGAFYADGLTCRQILAWAASIAGRYVRATADGQLEFAWYADSPEVTVVASTANAASHMDVKDDGAGNVSVQSKSITVKDDGYGNVTLVVDGLLVITGDDNITLESTATVIPFFSGKLSYESYTTDLIERVQINHEDDDVGVIYPEEATGNCFTISKNMILGVVDRGEVTKVTQSLYEQLNGLTYVPFSVTIPRTIAVRAGDKIVVVDSKGNTFVSCVMKVAVTPSGTTLSATGDKSYGSNAAVSSEKYDNLTGKILSLSKSVDGLKIRNEDLEGRASGLELSVESIKTYVETEVVSGEDFEKYKSETTQTAKDITDKFDSLDQDRRETNAHIKRGLLEETEAGPVYGVEIGQTTTSPEGEETFNKYARFTSDRLSFYDNGNNEVTQIGDKKMFVTNVEITGSSDAESGEYGTFKQGGFIDIAMADGTIVTKWVKGG